MTQVIKRRIEQLQHGEVPEGYKKTKVGIVPIEWEETRFKKMFSRVTRKNRENNDNVLTISAQYGLINQRDFFNKDIASDDKSNYFLLENGEFAYNKSYSNGYPFGALKRLDMYDKGIVSPLYICFAATKENKCPDYYVHYFEAGKMNCEIQAFAQEGARNHGLLNIAVDDFFNSNIVAPSVAEQEKIAEVLSVQGRVIELKEKLLVEKQQQKKYLMQQLLTGKKRLPGFAGEWFFVRANQIFKNVTDKKHDGTLEVLSATQDKGIVPRSQVDIDIKYAEESLTGYKKVMKGNFVISLRSFQGGIEYSEYTGIVSPAYTVLTSIYPIEDNYYKQFFKSTDYINRLNVAVYGIRDGKQIGYEDFGRIKIPYPPIDEQKAIATVLEKADQEIDLLLRSLDQEKQKKKALMQLLLTGIVRA